MLSVHAGALDGVGRRSSEQESALRRVSIDVEAMRGRPRTQDSAQSVTSGVRALEGRSLGMKLKKATVQGFYWCTRCSFLMYLYARLSIQRPE
jgi:hypothetical protein